MAPRSLNVRYNSNFNQRALRQHQEWLQETMQTIKNEEHLGYESAYASLFMLSDNKYLEEIKHLIAQKKSLNPAMMVVIGIGGSNLGTQAVHDALGRPGIPVLYADTLDAAAISQLLDRIELALASGQTILLTMVSKSGSTTETIINGSLFFMMLQRYRPDDYHRFIVVITEQHNELWQIAQEESWSLLAVPKQVGGRFSVLSAVGLFPLGMLGVDIDGLVEGAQDMVRRSLNDRENNDAASTASFLYEAYLQGYDIHDFFTFASPFIGLGKWYRQLLAESIGKEFTLGGKRINVGITPTVSVGSTDLHSMVELHLAGPHNTTTTFLNLKRRDSLTIPQSTLTKRLLPYAVGKSLDEIMDALLQGTEQAYRKKGLPFMSITFPEQSAWYIGQFVQWKMLEIIYLGALFNINCFDQPEVTLYKEEARAIISHE